MSFDDTKWNSPAIQGDVAAIALTVSIALDSIREALRNVRDNKDIDKQLDDIVEQSKKLDKVFDDLTGYTPDGR